MCQALLLHLAAGYNFDFRVLMQSLQQRGMKTLDFGGTKELVYERSDWPRQKIIDLFSSGKMAVIGYGTQGRAQSLNMKG